MKKLIAPIVLFLFVFVTAIQAQPKIGETAKDISLKNVKGVEDRLSNYKGKIVLVDFWASWCLPCRRSNRELQSLYSKYKDKGFEIFGISLDQNITDWKNAISTDRITWKQVSEMGGWNAPVALAWGIEQLPSSFLVGKDGKIIAVNPTKEEIEKHLKKSTP
jgi:peroxiredoxin